MSDEKKSEQEKLNEFVDKNQEQIIDRHLVTKGFMRDLAIITESMTQAGESEVVGSCNGWEYSFKKKPTTKEDLN